MQKAGFIWSILWKMTWTCFMRFTVLISHTSLQNIKYCICLHLATDNHRLTSFTRVSLQFSDVYNHCVPTWSNHKLWTKQHVPFMFLVDCFVPPDADWIWLLFKLSMTVISIWLLCLLWFVFCFIILIFRTQCQSREGSFSCLCLQYFFYVGLRASGWSVYTDCWSAWNNLK